MMPVDRFGRIVGEDEPANPADRYATPINRKPKRRRKRPLWETLLFYGLLALMICLGFYAVIRTAIERTHPVTGAQNSGWYTSYIHEGAGSTELGPVPVTGDWRFTWSCPVNNNAMSFYVKNEQGTILYFDNIECTTDDHADMEPITYTGQVTIEMNAVGSWTVSIQEPSQ